MNRYVFRCRMVRSRALDSEHASTYIASVEAADMASALVDGCRAAEAAHPGLSAVQATCLARERWQRSRTARLHLGRR